MGFIADILVLIMDFLVQILHYVTRMVTPHQTLKSGGVLVDSRAVVLNEDGTALQTTYAGHNTHGSIEKINDQWYAFYHRAPRGFGNASANGSTCYY